MSKKPTAQTIHEKLGLSFAELGALLGARNLLSANLIVHHDSPKTFERMNSGEHLFNMGYACDVGGCGSIGCIGGTMAQIMGMNQNDAHEYVHSHDWRGDYNFNKNRHRPIAKLFFPDRNNYGGITNEQAVKAIDSFLNDGDPFWEKA